MRLGWLALMIWIGCLNSDVIAQTAISDSIQQKITPTKLIQDTITSKNTVSRDSIAKPKLPRVNYSPKKATLFSAVPGGGQIYNKQYWKLPFVYIGLGIAIYSIKWNNDRYKHFVGPYKASYDSTGVAIRNSADVYISSLDIYRNLTLDQITRGKTAYKRYRDLSWFSLVGLWALAAIEANVSAHLKTFDLSEDLSLKVEPDVFMMGGSGVLGAKAVFTFK